MSGIVLSNTFCSSTMIPLCSGSQSWLDNAADRHDIPPPVLCPPPPETCDYPECTMITGRCSALCSLMSNWGREVFIYCFYGAIIEYWWFYHNSNCNCNFPLLAWTSRSGLVVDSGLGVLLRKDYSVIITFQLDVISSKFVDSHLRCKGSRNYQQQDLRFCTNTQEAFVFLDNTTAPHKYI